MRPARFERATGCLEGAPKVFRAFADDLLLPVNRRNCNVERISVSPRLAGYGFQKYFQAPVAATTTQAACRVRYLLREGCGCDLALPRRHCGGRYSSRAMHEGLGRVAHADDADDRASPGTQPRVRRLNPARRPRADRATEHSGRDRPNRPLGRDLPARSATHHPQRQ